MHDRDHAAAAIGEIFEKPHHHKLMADIQTGNRFVQQQPTGQAVVHRMPNLTEHAGQLRALLLSARKLLVKLVCVAL